MVRRRLLLLLVLSVALWLLASPLAEAQSLNDAKAYLDNVESEVMRVAAQATDNFVSTCGTPRSPSHLLNSRSFPLMEHLSKGFSIQKKI